MTTNHRRFTLIGMAGVGKSSIGRLLAKRLQSSFVDTDSIIQAHMGKSIYDYICEHSELDFLALESQLVAKLPFSNQMIIATGGSVVYSKEAMIHLKSASSIIYLKDSKENILQRIPCLKTRGIASPVKKDFDSLFEERALLYKAYANYTFEIPHPLHIENAVNDLVTMLHVSI
jgi:shikimate kinase